VRVSPNHPVLIDKYLLGKELEVDAICDGERVFIPGIMEHVERSGIHSGDSIAVYPAPSIDRATKERILDYTERLATSLNIRGILNIQYLLFEGELHVIEVNPRSSRTVPFLSKVTGVPMVQLATRAALGHSLADMGYDGGLLPEMPHVAVKAPVFSFAKLADLDTTLGPEMKSTGEVMGIDRDLPRALQKALLAANLSPRPPGNILATIADRDKEEAVPLLVRLSEMGYRLFATEGTAGALSAAGCQVTPVRKASEGSPHVIDLIRSGQVDVVINCLTRGKIPERDGFRMRRAAAELNIPCLTSLDTARAVVDVMCEVHREAPPGCLALQDYLSRAGIAGPAAAASAADE
ncbi:MAG: ATP-grasp domain-containing protein, partial [Bacillota bacterium]